MSIHVTTEHKTKPQHTNDVITTLTAAIPDSLQHDGCEAISLRRDQDKPTNIVSFTQWTTRHHYENYLNWRTEMGLRDEIGQLLTESITIHYYDELVGVSR